MSKYVVYYSGRKEMYRDMASRWYRWSNETNLTDDQRTGVALFFRSIGRRFGLLGEFREIGVI
jgi:hypothetical protein